MSRKIPGKILFFCSFLSCVSDPIHTVENPSDTELQRDSTLDQPASQKITRKRSDFLVFNLPNSLLMVEACFEPNCSLSSENEVFLAQGSIKGSDMDLQSFLASDYEFTGENFYVMRTYLDTLPSESKPEKRIFRRPRIIGELWRGSPYGGGSILAQNALLHPISNIALAPKRPLDEQFKSWCHYIFKGPKSYIIVPIYRPVRGPQDIYDTFLSDLRLKTDFYPFIGSGNWIIFNPQKLLENPETTAKIQVLGKFYHSKIHRVTHVNR
jgi:hypothetical protein